MTQTGGVMVADVMVAEAITGVTSRAAAAAASSGIVITAASTAGTATTFVRLRVVITEATLATDLEATTTGARSRRLRATIAGRATTTEASLSADLEVTMAGATLTSLEATTTAGTRLIIVGTLTFDLRVRVTLGLTVTLTICAGVTEATTG